MSYQRQQRSVQLPGAIEMEIQACNSFHIWKVRAYSMMDKMYVHMVCIYVYT